MAGEVEVEGENNDHGLLNVFALLPICITNNLTFEDFAVEFTNQLVPKYQSPYFRLPPQNPQQLQALLHTLNLLLPTLPNQILHQRMFGIDELYHHLVEVRP